MEKLGKNFTSFFGSKRSILISYSKNFLKFSSCFTSLLPNNEAKPLADSKYYILSIRVFMSKRLHTFFCVHTTTMSQVEGLGLPDRQNRQHTVDHSCEQKALYSKSNCSFIVCLAPPSIFPRLKQHLSSPQGM